MFDHFYWSINFIESQELGHVDEKVKYVCNLNLGYFLAFLMLYYIWLKPKYTKKCMCWKVGRQRLKSDQTNDKNGFYFLRQNRSSSRTQDEIWRVKQVVKRGYFEWMKPTATFFIQTLLFFFLLISGGFHLLTFKYDFMQTKHALWKAFRKKRFPCIFDSLF